MPTKIQKLSIRGIRSFSPDDSAAVIEFYSPLTVILGMNGTGKTTIIECLKYSTTGDLPPNAQRNGSFINGNTAKSKRMGEVKAQVKLLFSTFTNGKDNGKEQEHVVIRSLQATYSSTTSTSTNTTVKQKTLESVLITRDSETGQQESVSRKCSEFDSILPVLFQVSRSVLDNVIFCHQEDSLWPLSESSVLKKKFDDLFESVRYSSLLKTVKDSTRKQLDSLKMEQQHLLYFQKDREKSVKVRASLQTTEGRIVELEELVGELDYELSTILKRNEKCMEEYQSMGMLENELKLREREVEMLKENYESKRIGLVEVEDEDDEEEKEIKERIQEFMEKRDSLKDKVDQFRRERMDLDRELSDCNSELTLLMVEKSKLQHCREVLKQKIEQKQEIVLKLGLLLLEEGGGGGGTDLHKNIITQNMTESQQEDSQPMFIVQLDDSLRKIEQEIELKKKELQQRHREIEQRIMSHRMVLKEYKDAMEKYKKEKIGNQDKIKVFERELGQLESNSDSGGLERKKSEYEEEKAAIRKEQEEQEKEVSSRRLKESEYIEKEHLLESQLQLLRKELVTVQENQELMLKLDFKQKEIDSRYKERQKYLKMIQDEIQVNQFEINGKGGDLSTLVLQHHEHLKDGHQELLQKSTELDRDLAIATAQLQEEKQKLKELKQKEKQCCNFLKSKYKQTDLTLLQQELEQQIATEEDSMLYKNNQKLYDELLQKSLKDGVCFVCGTEGIDRDVVKKKKHQKELRSSVSTTSTMDIDTLRQRKKEMDKYVMLYEEPLKKLLKVELPECESKIEALDKKVEELNAKSEEAAADIVNSKVSLDALEQILKLSDDVKRIERDLKAKEGELEGLRSRLGSFSDGSTKTAGEVNLEIQRITEELQLMRNDWDLVMSEYNTKQNELLKRQASLREMEMEIMQLTRNEEECNRLNAQLNEVQEMQQRIELEMKEVEKKIQAQEGTADLEQELSEITACYEVELKQLQQEHLEKLSVKNKLMELNREISKLSAETQNDKYSDVCRKIEELQMQVANIQKRVQELSSLESFNQEFTRIVSTINNLNALLQVKSAHAELKLKEEEVQQMKDSYSNQFEQLEHYKRMLNDLKREQSQKTVELATLQGELKQLLLQKENIVNELETDYKDIDEKYKKQMIKVETLRLAAKDLDRCKQTFEGALLKYHSLKMEHLNKIIGELWRKTYKGNDIDSVEIRSETEAKAGSRSYSYRVVMIKGSDEMDMRGRSSAGQKVLASIIIRLALAETFGAKCGILALDEPTTNLDEANICSLAESLAEVIKERRKQANFQLILITHDEQFLQKIGLSNYTDYIYKVSKNHEQYSTITRIPVNEN